MTRRFSASILNGPLAVVLLSAAPALAQSKPPGPFEVTISIGTAHLAGIEDLPYRKPHLLESPYTFVGRLGGSYFWKTHLKTAVDVGWRTRTDIFDENRTGDSDAVVFFTHTYKLFRLSFAQQYQFRRHERFQPYVGAGGGLDVDKEFDGLIDDSGARTSDPNAPKPPAAPISRTSKPSVFATFGFQQFFSDHFSWHVELRAGNRDRGSIKFGLGMGF